MHFIFYFFFYYFYLTLTMDNVFDLLWHAVSATEYHQIHFAEVHQGTLKVFRASCYLALHCFPLQQY